MHGRKRIAHRWLVAGCVAAPLVACLAGCFSGGASRGIGFLLLALLAITPVAAVVMIVRGLLREHAERRDLRECLESPRFCRMMDRPSPAGLVSAAVMFICAAPFLLIAMLLVKPIPGASSPPGPAIWVGVAGLIGGSLFLQWIGMLRISDYLLARRAWKEGRRPAVSD
ncbi:MAG: hypothetical protein H6839_00030 [Planctomycetes bacterium]|nr:hypothetical protein [Planctomycetota bacterium]